MTSLTPLEDKMARFADLGVDTAYVFRFDQTFAKVTPEQFVREVLQALQVKRAVVGFDFTFGHRGAGDPAMLESLGAPLMQVDVAEPFHLDNKKVSSTSIRERLLEGNVEEAARLLGRPYQISGVVSHGDGRGRTIGYPTANISLSGRYALPRLGVYAVILRVGDRSCPGVMNIGVKPTFGSNEAQPTPEVHLFDFNGDLYGQLVHVDIQSFIRAEQRFNSVEQLIDQINKDALIARQLLQNMNNISSF
ncbi:riboflavin biosynthesis protein RibC [Paenibacillus abyssi]|uniref:Bifunctional riboflavin kinase/FMN adenylyltransferase n=2 Tax=Paenibacillus abyssi TaxID=1340531 RepID=A0A917D642_9BACL|nr:riboflavin biosynthesis protein RibC [Paenibacillus abyssi]